MLAVGAHPDDIELGLGSCLAKHIEDGDEVHVLIFSRGEKGVSDDKIVSEGLSEKEKNELKGRMREEETRKALNFLGVKNENIRILDLPDAGVELNEKVTEEVYKYIMEVNPDVAYTHSFEDDHLDHVSTSLITLHAGRKVKNILFYESPSTRTSFSPNYFVDVLEKETSKMDYFFRPEFLRGYDFTFGAAKKGGLSYFNELGSITNFSGTMYDIFSYIFEVSPEAVRDTIKDFIPVSLIWKYIPEQAHDVLGHAKNCVEEAGKDAIIKGIERGIRSTFEGFATRLEHEYTRLELRTRRGTAEVFRLTEKQDEIKNRKSAMKKELGSGGWVVHPTFRKILTEKEPPITFMLNSDAKIEMEDKTLELKKETPPIERRGRSDS